MDHRRKENFYIIVSPGLEKTCAAELTALEITPLEIETGGIVCAGRLRELYLASLWLRTASRILVRFAECRSRDFPDLYRKAQRLPWGRFIRPETPVAFRVDLSWFTAQPHHAGCGDPRIGSQPGSRSHNQPGREGAATGHGQNR